MVEGPGPERPLIGARTTEMAQILRRRMLTRIKTANDAGARFVMVEWVCPVLRPRASGATRTTSAGSTASSRGAVDQAVAEGGRAELLGPTDEVCVGGGAEGESTAGKNQATGNEVHVDSRAGGRWLWDTWLGPALTGR